VQNGAGPASRRRWPCRSGGSTAADGRRPRELEEAAMAPFRGGATAREGCAGGVHRGGAWGREGLPRRAWRSPPLDEACGAQGQRGLRGGCWPARWVRGGDP
jgi:hypothetical protein